jgi:hypothetical protein
LLLSRVLGFHPSHTPLTLVFTGTTFGHLLDGLNLSAGTLVSSDRQFVTLDQHDVVPAGSYSLIETTSKGKFLPCSVTLIHLLSPNRRACKPN